METNLGRPKVKDPKAYNVSIAVSLKQLERLNEEAKRLNISRSKLVRFLLWGKDEEE